MRVLRSVMFLSILLSSAALLAGNVLAKDSIWAGVTVLAGFIWLWAAWKGVKPAAAVILLLYAFCAGIGILRLMNPHWALAGLILALVSWDLFHFYWRWERTKNQQGSAVLARRHLTRLAVVCLIGLSTAELALLIRTRIGFGLLVFVGVVAVVMVGWVVNLVRRQV